MGASGAASMPIYPRPTEGELYYAMITLKNKGLAGGTTILTRGARFNVARGTFVLDCVMRADELTTLAHYRVRKTEDDPRARPGDYLSVDDYLIAIAWAGVADPSEVQYKLLEQPGETQRKVLAEVHDYLAGMFSVAAHAERERKRTREE